MKNLILSILALGSLQPAANATMEPDHVVLECGAGAARDGLGWVRLTLDRNQFSEGSDLLAPVSASLNYIYSGTQGMTCAGLVDNGVYDVNCVGYYYFDREITEVRFRNKGDKVVALWTTSEFYGSKDIESECK